MTAFGVLLAKELRVEVRSREMVTGGLLLVLMVLVLAHFAWGGRAPPTVLGPGVLWIAFVFAATIVLSRSVLREHDKGTWDALILLPVDWGILFLAKATAHALALVAVQAIALPLFALLFGADVLTPLAHLVPVLVLATIGLSAAGTLIGIASIHGRSREILLPVLLFPILIPLFLVAVEATRRVLAGEPVHALGRELQFLLAYDIIFLAIGWLTVDYLLGD